MSLQELYPSFMSLFLEPLKPSITVMIRLKNSLKKKNLTQTHCNHRAEGGAKLNSESIINEI